MEDINLDFLKTPPKSSRTAERCDSPYVNNGIDMEFGKRKHGKKIFEMAQSIAKADELLDEINNLKNQNNQLHSQLKDFQRTAQEVQQLYCKEKSEHESLKESFISLKKNYEALDADLTNKTMVSEQMKARLAEYEGRPIHFNILVVKYVNLMNRLEGDDVLKYLTDKELLDKLKDYCCKMKLKITSSSSPRKNTATRKHKIKTEEAYVQCNIYEKNENLQCPSCLLQLANRAEKTSTEVSSIQCNLVEEISPKKVITRNQKIQCAPLTRDQSSQYISTMITRQTNTEKVVRKHVQTMFPEPQTEPAIDDILNTYSKWSYIRSISPLRESPKRANTQLFLKSFNSIGTCTMLCNIRRKIDYLPHNNVSNIKQEAITPSASPLPNSQGLERNRQCNTAVPDISVITDNQSRHSSLLNLFNRSTNTSSLSGITFNAFNELWQIFGKMLLSLLQTSNAGISNVHPNSTINQQQFIDWLLDFYMSSQPQTAVTAQTQTSEETVAMTIGSPVRFNDNSTELSQDIVRPQAQKSMPLRENSMEMQNEEIISSANNSFSYCVNQTNYGNSLPTEEFSDIQNTGDTEIQQINTNLSSDVFPKNYNKSDLKDSCCAKKEIKYTNSIPNKVLARKNNLKRKKHKDLKKLLKKKNKDPKKIDPINAINSENTFENPSDNNEHIETAVDFLKMFANSQQNEELLHESLTKNTNIHKKKSTNESRKLKDELDNKMDFDFVKPFKTSPKQNKKLTCANGRIFLKRAINSLKPPKNVKSFDYLFGSSDSEEDETESEIDKQNKRPVIKTMEELRKSTSLKCGNNLNRQAEYSQELRDSISIKSPAVSTSKNEQRSFSKVTNNDNHSQDIVVKNTTIENITNLAEPPLKQNEFNYILEDFPLCIKHNEEKIGGISEISKLKQPTKTEVNFKKNISNGIIQNDCNPTDGNLTRNPIFDGSISLPTIINDDTEKSENRFNIKHSKAIYTSDFEKDFELSSDDESLIDNSQDNVLLEKENFEETSADNRSLSSADEQNIFSPITDNEIAIPDISQNSNESEDFVSAQSQLFEEEKIKSKENKVLIAESSHQIYNSVPTNFLTDNETVTPDILQNSTESEDFVSDQSQLFVKEEKIKSKENKVLIAESEHQIYNSVPTNFLTDNETVTPDISQNSNESEDFVSAQSQLFEEEKIKRKENKVLIAESEHQIYNSVPTNFLTDNETVTPDISQNSNESEDFVSAQSQLFEEEKIKSKENKVLIAESEHQIYNSVPTNFLTDNETVTPDISQNSNESEDFVSAQSQLFEEEKIKSKENKVLIAESSHQIYNSVPTNFLTDNETVTPDISQNSNESEDFVSAQSQLFVEEEKIKSKENKVLIAESEHQIYNSVPTNFLTDNETVTPDISQNSNESEDFVSAQSQLFEEEKIKSKENKVLIAESEHQIYNSVPTNFLTDNETVTPDISQNSTESEDFVSDQSQLFVEEEKIKSKENKVLIAESEYQIYNSVPTNFLTDNETVTPDISQNSTGSEDFISDQSQLFVEEEKIKSKENKVLIAESSHQIYNSVPTNFLTDNETVTADISQNSTESEDFVSDQSQLFVEEEKIKSKENKNFIAESSHQINNSVPTNFLTDNETVMPDISVPTNSVETVSDSTAEKSHNIKLNIETDPLAPSKTEGLNSSDNNIDSFSTEKLIIDEDIEEENGNSCDDKEDSLQSPSSSPILNSSLCNEILTDSINQIADDIPNEDNLKSLPIENKAKRGRKRKIEYITDLQPTKRSERLKAKQMILESSLNLSIYPIEIGKYTKRPEISSSKDKSQIETLKHWETKVSNTDLKSTIIENNELQKNEIKLQMGFFKERQLEETDSTVLKNDKKFGTTSLNNDLYTNDEHSEISESSLQESESLLNCNKTLTIAIKTPIKIKSLENETKTLSITEINVDEPFIECNESPKSPVAAENLEKQIPSVCITIPTERLPQYIPTKKNQTLFETLMNSQSIISYNKAKQSLTSKECKQQNMILSELEKHLSLYCYDEMELNSDVTAIRLINKLLCICPDYKIIYKSLILASEKAESVHTKESDLPSIIQDMPPRHLSKCMQRLFAVIRNFLFRNQSFCLELMEQIESVLFCLKQDAKLSLESSLNLTQLYLMACKVQESIGLQKNPLRLFIAKCLYYYVQKAILIIHEVLMWYPTVLPHREDKTYDRSDALITVIQYALMNTKYDMDKTDLRSKTLLSKLRYEYHFEAYKPRSEEVVIFLVDKIKSNKLHNLFLAFAILSKRLGVHLTQNIILLQHLLPLAQEYYNIALKTDEFDNSIATLLEIISIILKQFPFNTDVRIYLNEFSRFLNAFERPIIQEAALCSILRLQRFGSDECYNLLKHIQPTFELQTHTQAMLKTFLNRLSLPFWKTKKLKNSVS